MADNPINRVAGLEGENRFLGENIPGFKKDENGKFFYDRQENEEIDIAARRNGEKPVVENRPTVEILIPDLNGVMKMGRGTTARNVKVGGAGRYSKSNLWTKFATNQNSSRSIRDGYYVMIGVVNEDKVHEGAEGNIDYDTLFNLLISHGYDPLLPMRGRGDFKHGIERRMGRAILDELSKQHPSGNNIRAKLREIARECRDFVRDYISGGDKPPLKKATIDRREYKYVQGKADYKAGIDAPLVETGHLEKAITYKVVSYKSQTRVDWDAKRREREAEEARKREQRKKEAEAKKRNAGESWRGGNKTVNEIAPVLDINFQHYELVDEFREWAANFWSEQKGVRTRYRDIPKMNRINLARTYKNKFGPIEDQYDFIEEETTVPEAPVVGGGKSGKAPRATEIKTLSREDYEKFVVDYHHVLRPKKSWKYTFKEVSKFDEGGDVELANKKWIEKYGAIPGVGKTVESKAPSAPKGGKKKGRGKGKEPPAAASVKTPKKPKPPKVAGQAATVEGKPKRTAAKETDLAVVLRARNEDFMEYVKEATGGIRLEYITESEKNVLAAGYISEYRVPVDKLRMTVRAARNLLKEKGWSETTWG